MSNNNKGKRHKSPCYNPTGHSSQLKPFDHRIEGRPKQIRDLTDVPTEQICPEQLVSYATRYAVCGTLHPWLVILGSKCRYEDASVPTCLLVSFRVHKLAKMCSCQSDLLQTLATVELLWILVAQRQSTESCWISGVGLKFFVRRLASVELVAQKESRTCSKRNVTGVKEAEIFRAKTWKFVVKGAKSNTFKFE
jgi:hypothetical protein